MQLNPICQVIPLIYNDTRKAELFDFGTQWGVWGGCGYLNTSIDLALTLRHIDEANAT